MKTFSIRGYSKEPDPQSVTIGPIFDEAEAKRELAKCKRKYPHLEFTLYGW
jgi:hypothetical protein